MGTNTGAAGTNNNPHEISRAFWNRTQDPSAAGIANITFPAIAALTNSGATAEVGKEVEINFVFPNVGWMNANNAPWDGLTDIAGFAFRDADNPVPPIGDPTVRERIAAVFGGTAAAAPNRVGVSVEIPGLKVDPYRAP